MNSMTTQQHTEQRLIDLETRIAYQDDTIQTLSDELYRQQQELERLQQLCNLMLQRLQDITMGASDGSVDEKPPHY